MDLKVLFHNPEELSDAELRHLAEKIALQRTMPWISAAISGFGMYLLDGAFLKRTVCLKRTGAAALVGFALGAYSSYNVSTSIERIRNDSEIVNAFDRKYMNTVLNTTGFGSNYVSVRDYSDTTAFKKPY